MPTLAEVFELANRYGAKGVQFNIETKLDPTLPKETVAPGPFARKVIATIEKYGMTKRSLIQSFDWRTLVEARRVKPSLRRVALAQAPTIFKGTPWTAGIKIGTNPFGDGSLALAVKDDLKAHVLSPRFNDVTDRLIKSAHNRGLTVIPWTVNEKTDMRALIRKDVDGLITDYPDRLREVMDAEGLDLPDPVASPFDVEAHRGGRRYRPENTLAAFTLRSLAQRRHARARHGRDQGRRGRRRARPHDQPEPLHRRRRASLGQPISPADLRADPHARLRLQG